MSNGEPEQKVLTEGEANSDNAEHYRMQLDGETVDLRCYGSSSFVWAADDPSFDGRRDGITAYTIWMEDRNGSGVERISHEESVFKDVDERRDEEGIGDAR